MQREVVTLARRERRGYGTASEAHVAIDAVPAIDAENRLSIQHVVEESGVRRFIQRRQAALVVEDVHLVAGAEEVRRRRGGDRHVHVEINRLIRLHGHAVIGIVEELDDRRIRVYERQVQLPAEQRVRDAAAGAIVENLQRPVAKRVLAKERRERFLGQVIDACDDVGGDLLDPEDVEKHAGYTCRGGHDFQRGAAIQRIEEERAGSPRRCRGGDDFRLEKNAVGIQQPDVGRGIGGIGRVLRECVAHAIRRARNRVQVGGNDAGGDTIEIDEAQPFVGPEDVGSHTREIGDVRHDIDAAGRDLPAGEVRSRAEQPWSPDTILEAIGHEGDVGDVVRRVVVEVRERRRLELDGQTRTLGALGEGGVVVTGVNRGGISPSGSARLSRSLIHDDHDVRAEARTIIQADQRTAVGDSCIENQNAIVVNRHPVRSVEEIIIDH